MPRIPIASVLTLGVLLTVSSCAGGQGLEKAGTFDRYAVATANPASTRAANEVLAHGGTAIDAAVAAEAVLGLVEPQSSGLGGGAFLVYYDAPDQKAHHLRRPRNRAPAAARPDQFLGPDGKPRPFLDQVVGGQSVGIPGTIAMLALAQKEHGRLPWNELFSPAIVLAGNGFTVGARMHKLIGEEPTLQTQDTARKYFFDASGAPLAQGTIVKNYAETLRAIAADPRALYHGPIANAIIATVANAPRHPATITAKDLESYAPRERAAVCGHYHIYLVCGMGPPSSGGTTVVEILGMLERFDLRALGPKSPESWHLIAEAERLAYADRGRYLADADFTSVPVQGLTDPQYLKSRSLLIDPDRAAAGARDPGTPAMAQQSGALDQSLEIPSTSHFTIVDKYGNVAAMTASVESPFGSNLMVAGFVLNNELTDFSPIPSVDGKPVANALVPGKRPMSSMSPTIVFDDTGRFVMAIGSPGSRAIIGYVVQTIVGVLDWNLPMQQAIDMPHMVNLNGATSIEDGPDAAALGAALTAKGHTVRVFQGEESGLHGIRATPAGYDAAADRRREGVVDGGRTWWPWRWVKRWFE